MDHIEADMLHMHDVALCIAEFAKAPLMEEHACMARALAACITVADWQDCLDAFGDRDVGSFVADWADGAAYHPHASEGIAYCDIDDENAIVAEWDDAGFWSVYFTTPDKAREAVDDAYSSDDEDEDDDAS